MMNIGLSFLISWLANSVPTVQELLNSNKSLQDKLNDCFKLAINRWSAPIDIKRSAQKDISLYRQKLQEYIKYPERGMHPREKELMRLWAESIMANEECSSYVLSLKMDLIQEMQKDNFKRIISSMEEMNSLIQDTNQKINALYERGGESLDRFWNKVSIFGEKKQLPYSLITSGREREQSEVMNVCDAPRMLVIEAQSCLEAQSFAVAVLLENRNKLVNNYAIVVNNDDLYEQIVDDKERKIIITTITANHQLAVNNGHSVIYCVGPQNNHTDLHITLSEINRDGFISSLHTSGITDDEARRLALDSAKDINMLWRLLGIVQSPPSWETKDSIRKFIPIMFIGRWDEMCDDDKQLVAEIANCESYDMFIKELNDFIFVDESPIKRIETVFALKSPYAIFKRYFRYVTHADIQHFLRYVDLVLDDVDPDAIEKMESQELQFWHEKRVFSSNLRRGVIEGVTLISLMQEELQQDNIIEKWIADKFNSFDLQKYLSHKRNLLWMAEAAPRAFLQFIENDIAQGAQILDKLFIIRHGQPSLTGSEIYYTELLNCLECIAWHEDYLPRVTKLLLHMCAYPNNSNWVNRPTYSLKNIYRFVLPETLVSMSKRIAILKGLRSIYPEAIRLLCYDWLKGLQDTILHHTSSFRWRWLAQKSENPTQAMPYPDEELLRDMYDMMMAGFTWTEKEIVDLLNLSMHKYMNSLRADIITALRTHIDKIKGNDIICDELRHEIFRHMEYPDTCWALSKDELQLYKDLLRDFTLQDIINANKHYFESIFIHNPEVELSHLSDNQFERGVKIQAEIERQILEERGLDGMWELVRVAKSAEAVANGFTELTGDEYCRLVYERYCDRILCEEFVKRYYSNLYNKYGNEAYLGYIAEIQKINLNKIAIVLYAPSFERKLADLAYSQSETIGIEYWKNVQVWEFGVGDVQLIIDRLLYCKRYWDLLHFMTKDVVLNQLDNSTKGNVLYSIFQSDNGILILVREGYQLAKILSTIDVAGNLDLEQKVEQMEFYLYECLDHYLEKKHNHFQKAINLKPELMMEIVCALFKADNENKESISEEEKANRQFKAQIAYRFWYKYRDVPCTDTDGEVDESLLRNYLKRLQELSSECHRENVLPLVLGKILGNFQEGDDYPNELLCSLVEEYASDEIDNIIGCEIHNRRSFSTRSPFDGGTVERHHIATLRKYRDNAIMRSPRFVKILDDVIRSFEYSAKRNDFEGKMNNFNY